jgi:lysophospholipase L1-like esterase
VKPKKSFPSKLGKALFWLFAFVLVCEVGLRFFGYGSYLVYRPDSRLFWVPRTGHGVTEVNHLPITISEDGFRYREKLGPKPANEFRVFTLGDSVTMGWGVGDSQTYSAVLENKLNSGCERERFRVVSAGVNAYPIGLAEERMKKVVEDGYVPNAVVLAYSFNIGRIEQVTELQGADRQSFLRRVRLKSYLRRSALYNFVIEELLRDLVYYRLRNMMMQGSWTTSKEHATVDVERYRAGLKSTLQFCAARHIPLVLLLLSSENQGPELHPYQKTMLEFAQAENVPVVDMHGIMRSQDQKAMFMDHVHPTAAGHQLIGLQLSETLQGLSSYAAVCRK